MGISIVNENYFVHIDKNSVVKKFENVANLKMPTVINDSKWLIKYRINGLIKICVADDIERFDIEEGDVPYGAAFERSVKYRGKNDVFEVCVNFKFYQAGFLFDLDIKNVSGEKITIVDVIMSDAEVEGRMTLPSASVDLSMGEADFVDPDNFFQTVNAYPVFINHASFCGIEWPVAHNAFDGNKLSCVLYLKKDLENGEMLTTKKMYFGAAEEEGAAKAFNARLIEMRERPTNRKSMYFTWLTHGWEGLTVKKTDDLIEYFIMLYKEYGVHYDVFLFDAGVVETMESYYDKWKLARPEMMHNMERFAEKLKSIGTQVGIWLGPDGYGETEESAKKRREQLKWMVEKWNVGMIKFDVAVSYPIKGHDVYFNNWYMEQLERSMKELREIRPDLVVVNHRIIESPYIISILDSTLWASMETYADVYLMNYSTPRPYSRYGTFDRGLPKYCGSYNPLQEDHGVCFNGRQAGWMEDFLVQAFGRALAVSPENYGMMFCLDDEDYPVLSKMLKLAKEYGELLANTDYMNGDFVHSNSKQTLICLLNSSKNRVVKNVCMANVADAEILITSKNAQITNSGNQVSVEMQPFEVTVVLVGGTVLDISQENVGRKDCGFDFVKDDVSYGDEKICEGIKFNISSDSLEYQEIKAIKPSKHPEVMACRENSIEMMKKFNAISDSAWDGREDTAWSDGIHYKKYEGMWRVNLGALVEAASVEFNLAGIRQESGKNIWEETPEDAFVKQRKLGQEDIKIVVSNDGEHWIEGETYAINELLAGRVVPTSIVAGFDEGVTFKYIKMNARGILVREICLRNKDGEIINLGDLKGNNLLSDRKPREMYRKALFVNKDTQEKDYTAYVKLVDKVAPLTQEVAFVWLEKGGELVLPTITSPAYQFTSWENNTLNEGNSWSFTFKNLDEGTYTVNLAYIGPFYHPSYETDEQQNGEEIIVGDFWS